MHAILCSFMQFYAVLYCWVSAIYAVLLQTAHAALLCKLSLRKAVCAHYLHMTYIMPPYIFCCQPLLLVSTSNAAFLCFMHITYCLPLMQHRNITEPRKWEVSNPLRDVILFHALLIALVSAN